MLLKICQYLLLSEILILKKCLPEIEHCGILANYLIPHQNKMKDYKNLFHKFAKICRKMLNEKKLLNHEMICDKEIEHLIYLGREAELNMRYWRHHQKIYKKLMQKMKYNTMLEKEFDINTCFGCGLKSDELFLHLKYAFPLCSVVRYKFLPLNVPEEEHTKICWCYYMKHL